MDVNEIKSNGGSKVADTSSLDDFIMANHKKKFRFGIIISFALTVLIKNPVTSYETDADKAVSRIHTLKCSTDT